MNHRQGRKKLNIMRRVLCLVLVLGLVATSGIFPESLRAAQVPTDWKNDPNTTVQGLIVSLIQKSLQASLNSDADPSEASGVTNAEIVNAFEEAHLPTAPWSTTNLHTVAEVCVNKLVDQGIATLDNAKLQAYSGSTMPLDYTLGNLMVDWARINVGQAAMVSDDTLINFYDDLVANATNNPYITLQTYGNAVEQKAKDFASDNNVGDNKVNVLKTDNYITYRDYVAAGNIAPAGTLFIGTWMMNAQTMNETMYRKAVRSMAEDSQQIMYYKSELAGSRWRDISSATSLSAILPAGDDIPDTELMNYYITVIVGSDGIPKDAKTGQYVDIFNLSSPYELETLPELKGIRLQIDAGNLKPVSQGGTGAGAYTYDRVRLFFEHDQPFPRTQEVADIVQYWKNASINNRDYLCAWDFNGGEEKRELDYGWRRHFLFWSWWRDDSTITAFKKRYTGDMQLVDMLQTDEEYGHEITYYFNEGSGGDGEDTYYNPFPQPQIHGRIYHSQIYAVQQNPLHWWEPQNLISGTNRVYLRGQAVRADCPLVGYYGPWDQRAIGILGTNDINVIRYRINLFKQFWAGSTSIRDDETDRYDQQLAQISNLYLPLKQAGYEEEADRAMLLQEKLDSARRSRAYYNLVMNDNHNYGVGAPLNNLFSQVAYGTSDYGRSYAVLAGDYGDEGDGTMFSPDSSMMDVVGTAVTEATSAYNKYDSTALKNGNTVSQQFEYETSEAVINNALMGAEANLGRLQMLVDLDNILGSTIQHKNRELTTLNALLTAGDARVMEKSHETASEEYVKALNDPDSSEDARRKILQGQKAELSGVIGEDQQFIKARVIRLERTPALSYIDERINWADNLKGAVSTDDYGVYEVEAIDAHIEWLKALKKTVIGGGDMDGVDPAKDKAELNLERLDLLDNGDLDGVESLDKSIEEADAEIEEKRNRNLSILDGTGTAAEKADAEGELDDLEGAKRDIGKDIKAKIETEDWERLPDLIEAGGDIGLNMDDLPNDLKRAGAPVALQHFADDEAKRAKTSPFYDDGKTGDNPGGGGTDGDAGTGDTGDGSGEGGTGGPGGRDGEGNEGGGTGGDATGPDGDNEGDDGGNGDNEGDGTSGGTGTDGSGGSGTGNNVSGRGLNGGGGSGASGLNGNDLNGAIEDVMGDPFDSLSDSDKATTVAALNKFADNRGDDEIRQRVKDLLSQLLAEGNGFIYRQYLGDPSKKYVSLAAVDKCRPLTKNRCVYIGDKATMSQITGGSASYEFTIGSTSVISNDGNTSEMTTATTTQSDPSIHGNRKEQYPYITEEASAQYLKDTCEYIPDSEWAILIAPSMSKKVIQLLEVLDTLADE